jgi:hypothetical protein
MPNIRDVHAESLRLASLLDDLAAGCDSDFDTSYDDLEREFAELRMHFGNQ